MTTEKRQALVTGGAKGIGRGVVHDLLEHGWQVAAMDVDGTALDALGEAPELTRITGDVADEGAVKAAVARLDWLDLLVSNAGIAGPENGPVEDLSLDEWNRRIATNLTGSFLMAKHCVPKLRAAQGSIVVVTSTRAFMSEPHTEAYAASKGGLTALTHALAVSLGPAIRVNAVAPGWIVTGDPGELRPEDHAQHPAGRAGTPADIAEAVRYLADAGFVTGQTITVDGGMTVKMIYEE
ncbi:SDR family oxidoreductase [Oceaniglobus roseus]|uniref:SDR family oxidoreductase n=1 Tax=Oceaniglobus roseus TaxID=1737570 RepID=UPI000C7E86BC|nr:SDR family oxidoreductase [Kandeliimicrobium roseum]